MANYNCAIRTNYFHVNVLDVFMNLMDQVVGSEGEVELWKETDQNGDPIFAFGCYGGIAGIPDDLDNEFDDDSYDRFIAKLQECLADKDAVIIMESGHEKLRYVTGSALIITSSETKYLDITKLAVEEAGKMLGKDFTTRVDY